MLSLFRSARQKVFLYGILMLAVGFWIGCQGPDSSSDSDRAPGPVTFNRDIAPIVFKHCSGCHRPGQSGPFDLLTYEDVRKRAQQVAVVTQSRFMPPWLPEPVGAGFVGSRRLSVRDLGLFQQWVDEGALEGESPDLPSAPQWTEGWQLGEPDLVVEMLEPYTLPADPGDVFRNFVIPSPVSQTRYVRAWEFRPGNARIVHHTVILVDETRTSRRLDRQDPEPGYDGMLYAEARSPGGTFVGWTPGKSPFQGPDDMAWRLDPEMDVVIQLHLLPSGKPEPIRSSLGLYFADKPPTRIPTMVRIGSTVIDIPAGKSDYKIAKEYRLPVEVEVLGVYPHAHYLAREMKGFATLPDGSKQWLVHIKNWNFDWQDEYRYRTPILLPRGTTLSMEFTYDNSSENIRNPHVPARRVVYGPQSSDEMGDLWVQVLSNDLATLERDFAQTDLLEIIGGYEKMLEADPGNPDLHDTLAQRYLRLGNLEKAADHWQKSAQLQPNPWASYFNLGNVFDQKGEKNRAITFYRKVLSLKADHVRTHNNLGVVLQSLGKPREAIRHFRQALHFEPTSREAHSNLGGALAALGQFDEAASHFGQALESDPSSAEKHNNLGSVLALQGKLDQAASHFRQAAQLDPGGADAHSNLGKALASQGRFQQAILHFRKTVKLRTGPAEAHHNLGKALARTGQSEEALEHFREASRREPDQPAPLREIAWILATHPDVSVRQEGEAIQLAQRASELTQHRSPLILDTLAAAYASAGRFDEAQRVAQAALELASTDRRGQTLALGIQARLELFRKGRPYREQEGVEGATP